MGDPIGYKYYIHFSLHKEKKMTTKNFIIQEILPNSDMLMILDEKKRDFEEKFRDEQQVRPTSSYFPPFV